MAAWELTSWLALIRTFQLLGALAGASLNGFVAVMIYLKDRDLLINVVVLELLICSALCYTAVALILQHSGQRSKKPSWLICFLIFDCIAIGMTAVIAWFLSQAGLPSNCVGLAMPGDEPDDPRSTYTNTRFSNESPGQRGEMDKLCAFERSYFFVDLGLMVTFIVTVVLIVFRVRERKQVSRSTKDTETGDDDIDLKTLSATSPLTSSPVARSPLEQQQQNQQQQQQREQELEQEQEAPPPSEGIITRNTSLRSTVTSSTASHGRSHSSYSHGRSYSSFSHGRSYSRVSTPPAPPSEGIITRNTSIRSTMTSSTASHGGPPYYRSGIPNRRPVGQQSDYPSTPPVPIIGNPHVPPRRPVLPPRPTPPYEGPSSSSSSNTIPSNHMTGMGQGFVPIPLEDEDNDDDDFADALVSDGMQHQQRAQMEQQAQFTRQRLQMQQAAMPMLPEDEQFAAEHALVSDGMRPSEPMLPPYEPGENRMPGHGAEDNETRLSEYVKGQTRAQDMKDRGGY
ncbi:hypothetical protein V8F06_000495 [Rhypophila decipiens]